MNKVIKLIGIIGCITLASCTAQRNLIYFQDDKIDGKTPDEQLYQYEEGKENNSPEYKLQAGDLLYVNMYSTVDKESNDLLNSQSVSVYGQTSEVGLYLWSYEVDSEGNILLPIVGKINVNGLSIEQAKTLIKTEAEKYVNDMVISCRMVSFKIKVAGEVNRPGIFTFYQTNVNIFDALLAAGDLTYDGNRSKVRVVRKSQNEDLIYTLDIRKSSIMQDPRYYLRPGDIVYVEPNKNTKTLTAINRPLSTISSSVSLIASMIALYFTIKKL